MIVNSVYLFYVYIVYLLNMNYVQIMISLIIKYKLNEHQDVIFRKVQFNT